MMFMSETFLAMGDPPIGGGEADVVEGSSLLYRQAVQDDEAQHSGSRAVGKAVRGVVVGDHNEVVRAMGCKGQSHSDTSTGAIPGLNLMWRQVRP
jgi:hypothetical protein